jgi:hypothetical protein
VKASYEGTPASSKRSSARKGSRKVSICFGWLGPGLIPKDMKLRALYLHIRILLDSLPFLWWQIEVEDKEWPHFTGGISKQLDTICRQVKCDRAFIVKET